MLKQPFEKDILEQEILGDMTAYGEFVATFHHWTGLEGNHIRGRHLEYKSSHHVLQVNLHAADIPAVPAPENRQK